MVTLKVKRYVEKRYVESENIVYLDPNICMAGCNTNIKANEEPFGYKRLTNISNIDTVISCQINDAVLTYAVAPGETAVLHHKENDINANILLRQLLDEVKSSVLLIENIYPLTSAYSSRKNCIICHENINNDEPHSIINDRVPPVNRNYLLYIGFNGVDMKTDHPGTSINKSGYFHSKCGSITTNYLIEQRNVNIKQEDFSKPPNCKTYSMDNGVVTEIYNIVPLSRVTIETFIKA